MLGLLLLLSHGSTTHFDHFFHPEAHSLESVEEIKTCCCVWMAALASGALMRVTLDRASQCLDFGLTAFSLDLVFTWTVSQSWPRLWSWWIVHLLALGSMVLSGESLMARVELADIPLFL